MRKTIFAVVVVVACAGLFLMFRNLARHRLEVTTYFADAQGLRKGALVRLAGVNVGTVSSVRVRSDIREHPAEIRMALLTDYDLSIPNDSVVSLHTAGVLGQTYLAIDLHSAVGPRIRDGGTLKSVETTEPTTTQLVQRFAGALDNCDSLVKKSREDAEQVAHPKAPTK